MERKFQKIKSQIPKNPTLPNIYFVTHFSEERVRQMEVKSQKSNHKFQRGKHHILKSKKENPKIKSQIQKNPALPNIYFFTHFSF
jgi:hypothetical protein